MYNESNEKLEALGAVITAKEIKQQPSLWKQTFKIYKDNKERIQTFLKDIQGKHHHIRVIFTGAGTSAYVGETVTPYLKGKVDESKWDLFSIPTTSIVSNPYHYLKADIPTLLVSFARSGNSPESVATVELAKQIVHDLYQITITCAPEGKLAQKAKGDDSNLLLLMPEGANDQGFAMTGSYSCMTLTALLTFDNLSSETEESIVDKVVKLGESVIERESSIQEIIHADFDRIIYLGSGSLEGLSQEAQLKILELTAGKVVTNFDSPLGFRHGPKSFVNENALVFVFVSNDPYTKKYDYDILNELRQDNIARNVCAIKVQDQVSFEGTVFEFDQEGNSIPDAYLSLPFVMFAQTISLLASVKFGIQPDTPFPKGNVNRVVKGVTIHEYQK